MIDRRLHCDKPAPASPKSWDKLAPGHGAYWFLQVAVVLACAWAAMLGPSLVLASAQPPRFLSLTRSTSGVSVSSCVSGGSQSQQSYTSEPVAWSLSLYGEFGSSPGFVATGFASGTSVINDTELATSATSIMTATERPATANPWGCGPIIECSIGDSIHFSVSRRSVLQLVYNGQAPGTVLGLGSISVSEFNGGPFVSLTEPGNDEYFVANSGVRYSYQFGSRQRARELLEFASSSGRLRILGPCTTVLTQPRSTTVCAHDRAAFRFVVEGVSGLTYQWRREGVPLHNGDTGTGSNIDGATTDTLTITNVQFADAANYDCVVSSPIGLCTSAISQPARLDIGELCCVQPAAVTGTFLRVNGDPSATGPLVFDLFECGFSCGMSFRWRTYGGYYPCGNTGNPQTDFIGVFSSSPTVLPGSEPQRIPGAVASNEPNFRTDPTPIGELPTDIPQDFILSNNATYTIPCGARYLIAAPRPFNCGSPGPGSNTPIDPAPGGSRVAVLGCGRPSVLSQPAATRGCMGGSTTLAITAANWGPWTYRWRRNGTLIDLGENSSAATSTLTLSNLQASDAAAYDCVISNACGSVTSVSANVAIDSGLPLISSQPVSIRSCLSPSPTFSVTVGAPAHVTYHWQIQTAPAPSESWQTLGSDPSPIACAGGGTGTAWAGPAGAPMISIGVGGCAATPGRVWPIRCIVSNGCGSVPSSTGLLMIVPCACNPADIANTDGTPGPDNAVDNGDFSLFFTSFFGAQCPLCGHPGSSPCNAADVAATDGSPGPDGCVDNGDFSLVFTSFFAGCP